MHGFQIRLNQRLVTLVGAVERLGGYWACLSATETPKLLQMRREALEREVRAALSLGRPGKLQISGQSSHLPDAHTKDVRSSATLEERQNAIVPRVWAEAANLSLPGLVRFSTAVANLAPTSDTPAADADGLRTTNAEFSARLAELGREETIFPAVQVYLVRQRILELLEWTRTELAAPSIHPLFVPAVFHLAFLQIMPLPKLNHRVGLLLLSNLLRLSGCSFAHDHPLISVFCARRAAYFSALKQSERTAYASWSTLNVWLEFFLDALQTCGQELIFRYEKIHRQPALTASQQSIIEVVTTNGSATRERIATETGINLATVKYHLNALTNRGFLRRDGKGRATSYRAM